MMRSEKEFLKVLMFPWLAHGHITPILELAKGLSETNFICYICSTAANLSSINNRIPAKYESRIHLLRLDVPPSPDLPPHFHTTNGLPLRLHPALMEALRAARPSFLNLAAALQPDLLIYDVMQLWAASTASALKIPGVVFFPTSAAMLSHYGHLRKRSGVDFPFAATRLSRFEMVLAIGHVQSYERVKREERETYGDDDDDDASGSRVILVNSSREMEGKYLDYYSEVMEKKAVPVPIGAFVQDSYVEGDGDGELMEWLGKKDVYSTVFVSFGSEYFLRREEIEVIAHGLELSNVNFIWIMRFPKGEEMKIEEALPQGFLERVGERGKIVEKWAPQAKILGHVSIGGFVSHCGWNSLKESVSFGVPIIAMPMHHDQPVNAKLAAELGVGVEVKRDHERRFVKEEISNVIKELVAGKTGEVLRSRVGELRERIRCASREEMEGVAHLLAQLCLCGNTIASEFTK